METDTALDSIDTSQVDNEAKQVLNAVFDHDGEATTSEIRRETGLEKHIIHYRYDKLSEQGLLTTERSDTPLSGPLPPLVATLTETGRRAINEGLVGDVFDDSVSSEVSLDREQFRDFRDALNRLDTQSAALADDLRQNPPREFAERLDQIESDVEELDSRLTELEDVLQSEYFPRLVGLFDAVESELDVDAREYVNNQEANN